MKLLLDSYEFKISQEILGARIRAGLQVREMAERVGMDEATYRKYENGIAQERKERYEDVLKRVRSVHVVLLDPKGNWLVKMREENGEKKE